MSTKLEELLFKIIDSLIASSLTLGESLRVPSMLGTTIEAETKRLEERAANLSHLQKCPGASEPQIERLFLIADIETRRCIATLNHAKAVEQAVRKRTEGS
ncbi:MAG: hypothetical protein JST00_30180 [Deltaproteobacteria bacterium]|nr:hypothetical protein [Deltaproteobacteria bacterium]